MPSACVKVQSMASPEESGDGDGCKQIETLLGKNIEIETVHFLLAARDELRDKMHAYDEFIQTMLEIRTNLDNESFSLESCNARVRSLFVGRPRLVKGFQDLSEGLKPFGDEPRSLCDPMAFLQNMKTCPNVSHDEYNTFLEALLQFYNKGTMSIDDLVGQVMGFLSRSPKLLEDFRSYLPPRLAAVRLPHEQSDTSPKTCRGDKAATGFGSDAHRSLDVTQETNGKHKVSSGEYPRHGRDKRKHVHRESSIKQDKIESECPKYARKHSHRDPDFSQRHLMEDGEYHMVDDKDDEDEKLPPKVSSTDDKLPPKVDLSDCRRCTPSYCVLPENSCDKTKQEKSVLNDTLVSVTSGSEVAYKFRTRNQYEENILRCEDDMFERDVLLQRFGATAKLIKKLQADVEQNVKVEVEKHLTPLHRRCIEQLYDIHGLEMLDALSENTSTALPVILTRLNQKIEDLSKARLSLKNTWADVIANNYRRSLDHRGASFKQEDIKRMSPKALLAEAKETKILKMNAEDKLLSSVWKSQHPLFPEMVLDRTDLDTHKDIQSIVYDASSRSCNSAEQHRKVTIIWTELVEPFFGVDRRSLELKDNAASEESSGRCSFSKDISSSTQDVTLADGDVPVMNVSMGAPKSIIDDVLVVDKIQLSSEAGECCGDRFNECNSSYHGSDKKVEDGEFIPDVENVQMGTILGPGEGRLNHNEKLAASRGPGSHAAGSEPAERVESTDNCNEMGCASHDLKEDYEVRSDGMSRDVKGGIPFPLSGCSLPRALIRHVSKSQLDKKCEDFKEFYGSSSFYVLFRLHQVLYERLQFAKNILSLHTPEGKMNPWKDVGAAAMYDKFKEKLCSLLDGSIDNYEFEDYCLPIIGSDSYVLFTLDKLISRIFKQLCKIASNDKDNMLSQLPSKEQLQYQNARGNLLKGRIFRFACSSSSTLLSIEQLEVDQEEDEKASETSEPKSTEFLYEGFLPDDLVEKVKQNHFENRKRCKLETGE